MKEARGYYLQSNLPSKRRIIISGEEIVPLYDVPHLIKGIRNNFMKRHLVWENSEGKYIGKWGDIEKAYEIDRSCGDISCIPKITELHVNPKKIKKMKVSYATQVFSHTMAATVNIMARNGEF